MALKNNHYYYYYYIYAIIFNALYSMTNSLAILVENPRNCDLVLKQISIFQQNKLCLML